MFVNVMVHDTKAHQLYNFCMCKI